MIASEPKAGDVLDDRYRIVGLLGTGGMGSVYRAEHVGIRRPVAIKLLHPDLADDPDFAKRFEREAFVTGRTSHPNCVTVSDFGKLDGGAYYLVMELVDGVLLADLLDEQPRLPEQRALHIARHVLRGLGHAHAAGIVHRDIKPANVILVEQDGDRDFAKLLDFGIAKVIGEATADAPSNQLTRVGTTVGTPTYVAPEQAVGGPVDGRADLYALSVMLYEMLTGEPPFRNDDTVKLLAMHLSAPVPPMGLVVRSDVEQLVVKGLAKDRAERWASAADYGAAIDDLLIRPIATPVPGTLAALPASGATAMATPMPFAATVLRPPRSRRVAWIAAGVAALALLIVVAVAQERSKPAPSTATPAAQAAAGPQGTGAGELAVQADALLANGRAAEAVALLSDRPEIAGHGGAQLRLGHALAATDEAELAIDAYALAIGLEPASRGDAVMRANLSVIGKRKEIELALPALELLATRLADAGARAGLIEMAGKDKRNSWRWRARAIAEKAGWAAEVDRLASYLLDLGGARTCEDRRKAVPRLVELGDPRAVPWLEKARRRTSGGLLGFGEDAVNGCMHKELDAAIAALSKPGAAP